MFFRSWASLLAAIILIVIGCFQLDYCLKYADSARREVSTKGVLSYVSRGKSSTYEFSFEISGFTTGSVCGSCKTALTPEGCKEGAPVLVYYDPEHRSPPMLEEFGAASRERLFMGAVMVFCGCLLIALFVIFRRVLGSPEGSEETDESENISGTDVIHIFPGE